MPEVRASVAAQSDVGRVRAGNEDAFTVTHLDSGSHLESGRGELSFRLAERGVLLAVSDGMGGHQAGEVASALVIGSLRAALQAATPGTPIEQAISAAVRRANADILEAARETQRQGMGATLTAVLVRGTEAYIAEVGDSRAYLMRGGRLRQITRDQSMVQLMVDRGVLSPEDARRSSHKNLILQALGLAEGVQVAIGRIRCRRGDRILICCDGLSNALNDGELAELLAENDPKIACERMISLANERGGEDNLTAVVAHLDGEGLELPDPSQATAEIVEVLQAFEPELGDPEDRSETTPSAAAPTPETVEPEPAATSPEVASANRAREQTLPAPPLQGKRGWLLPALLLALALAVAAYLLL